MSRNLELLQLLDKVDRRPAAEYPVVHSLAAPAIEARVYEELTRLVQCVFLSSRKKQLRQVLFAGPTSQVGCTWMVANLAKVLSTLTPRTVCVVEASTGSSALGKYFEMASGDELCASQGDEQTPQALAQQVCRNLWVLPAGGSPMYERPEEQITALSRHFEYVLIDGSPVLSASSNLSLCSALDAAVLVLRAGHTRRGDVRMAIRRLQSTGVLLLGVVLNQIESALPAAIYKWL